LTTTEAASPLALLLSPGRFSNNKITLTGTLGINEYLERFERMRCSRNIILILKYIYFQFVGLGTLWWDSLLFQYHNNPQV
jgi:hypothetical protein